MSDDLAQLRESLRQVLHDEVHYQPGFYAWQMESEVRGALVDGLRELIALKEAGALIVVPDEALEEQIAVVIDPDSFLPDNPDNWGPRLVARQKARKVVNALRDAKPQEDATCDQPPMGCDKPRGHEGPHESDGVQYSLSPFVGVRDAKPEGETL